jgi:hypothetical protein
MRWTLETAEPLLNLAPLSSVDESSAGGRRASLSVIFRRCSGEGPGRFGWWPGAIVLRADAVA